MSDDAPIVFLPLGAIIQKLIVNGTNIVQGFPTAEDYVRHNSPYFGETIGRVANRIKGAQIDSLNAGQRYKLAANDGANHLHGGNVGWGKRVWDGPQPVSIREVPGVPDLEGGESVGFALTSPDGDEGYPGAVEARITYTTGTQRQPSGKEALVLAIEYEAALAGDGVAEETAINMTNHSYFNLGGGDTIADTSVALSTNLHLPVDDGSIPVAEPTPYPGIEPDTPIRLDAAAPSVDHCFVVAAAAVDDPTTVPVDTRDEPLRLNLSAYHPKTGIHLEVHSTEPSFQFYTGDGIDVPAVDGQPARGVRAGFCCEPGRFVNAVNVPEWRGMVILKKGKTYGARIVYKAWAD